MLLGCGCITTQTSQDRLDIELLVDRSRSITSGLRECSREPSLRIGLNRCQQPLEAGRIQLSHQTGHVDWVCRSLLRWVLAGVMAGSKGGWMGLLSGLPSVRVVVSIAVRLCIVRCCGT